MTLPGTPRIFFRTLGAVELVGLGGQRLLSVAAQPKRLALLAYLTVAGRGAAHRRDTLVALFWPELSSERARAALRKALHYLREGLGPGVIVTTGDEMVAVSGTALECDARMFQQALDRGVHADAVELYTGDFLPGLHLSNVPEFERWLDAERRGLGEAAVAAAMALAAAEQKAGRHEVALRWAHRAVGLAPLEERAVRLLLELLEQMGDRSGAVRAYDRYARSLARDLEAEPSQAIRQLLDRIERTPVHRNPGVLSEPAAVRLAPQEVEPGPPATARPAEPPQAPVFPGQRISWRAAIATLILATAILLGGVIGKDLTARPDPPPIRSLAVLSLRNLTGDSAQDYYAEGLTQALAAELSRARTVQVVSGGSTRRYSTGNKTAPQIAGALGVDALVEGSLVRRSDRVQFTVNVVDGRSGQVLWTGNYDREVEDILTLYPEVARGITEGISVPTPDTLPRAANPARSVNPAAYDAYLRGEYFRKRWMDGGCVPAERYFQQAIVLDSTFAGPFAGLAGCYAHPDRLRRPAAEIYPKARAAAQRALELDQNLAAAHAHLGYISHRLEYDWEGAGRAFQRAVDLNPGDPDARRFLGEFLYLTGRPDDGVAEMRYSLQLDPFAFDNSISLGYGLRNLRRYDEAIAVLAKTLELDPGYSTARLWLAEAYASRGNHDLAVNEYLTWLREVLLPDRVERATAELAGEYGRSGIQAFWRAELKLCQEETRRPRSVMRPPFDRYCGPYFMARRYARLGDRNRAIGLLGAAFARRHHLMVFHWVEPLFDGLRSDRRFQDLGSRMGRAYPH